MAQQVAPTPQLEFHGVVTSGNPALRPQGTAAKCQDFRVMPGFWLRTAGGRVARYNIPSAVNTLRIVPFRNPQFPGASQHNAQVNLGSGTVQWVFFDAVTLTTSPAWETISTSLDGAFASSNPVAACNLTDRPLVYNGLGVRDGSGSRPPFATLFNGVTRYYGLDAYCPGSPPSVAFAAGAGHNSVNTSVSIYVGLYNSGTGHYSNAVFVGKIAATPASGTITVSNLQNLPIQSHNNTELTEQNYVFYSTIDGGAVPYLIFNSGLTGPFTAAHNATTASLSIVAATVTNPNGWILDITAQGPIANFPPRPMRSICYVNGRVYGIPMLGGSAGGATPDFNYQFQSKDLGSIVWSLAAGDSQTQNILGDPNQCWPFGNQAYTPSSDAPIAIAAAQDAVGVLALTPSSSFILQEVTDGVQEYITISRRHGCASAASVAETPYGIVWVTQRNEIVMLPPMTTQLVILSRDYQNLLPKGVTVTASDWVYDPNEQIDRYQVWLSNGTSVCHDFALGSVGNGTYGSYLAPGASGGQVYGEGYLRTTVGGNVTAAGTCITGSGLSNFVIAIGPGLYTHETQADTGVIPTTDKTFIGSSSSTTTAEINGEYHRNWDHFGDDRMRKQLPSLDVLGDGALSSQLGNVSPIAVQWYTDLQQVTGANLLNTTIQKSPQSLVDYEWLVKFAQSNYFWFKIVLKLAGHSTDDASFANHINWAQQGDLAKNFYGSILKLAFTLGTGTNRP